MFYNHSSDDGGIDFSKNESTCYNFIYIRIGNH